MKNKKEWMEEFLELNDREPTIEEVLEAKERGEFEYVSSEGKTEQKKTSLNEKIHMYLERVKGLTLKSSQKSIWVVSGGLLIFLSLFVFFFFKAQPHSVIREVKIDFSGYDKKGRATLSGSYQEEIDALIAKKVGYSRSDVEAVRKGREEILLSDTSKYLQFSKYYADVSVSLNQTESLSNNQKIILNVQTELKDNPIKSEKKEIKVSGLKPSREYTATDVLKKFPVQVKGYNHFGQLDYDSEYFYLENAADSQELSNGDTVSLAVAESYVSEREEEGEVLSGDNHVKITVEKLEGSPQIDNLSELLSQNDTVVRAEKKSNDYTTYTVKRAKSYFIGKNISGLGYEDKEGFSVVSVYQVVDEGKYSGKTTNYYIYGYSGLELKENKVNISALKDYNKYKDYMNYGSEDEAFDDLKSKYPSLVALD